MTYRTGDSPDISQCDIPKVTVGYGVARHKVVVSCSSGRDSWLVRCECGWFLSGWRWLCEEAYFEHLPSAAPKDTWGGVHDHNAYVAGAPKD